MANKKRGEKRINPHRIMFTTTNFELEALNALSSRYNMTRTTVVHLIFEYIFRDLRSAAEAGNDDDVIAALDNIMAMTDPDCPSIIKHL